MSTELNLCSICLSTILLQATPPLVDTAINDNARHCSTIAYYYYYYYSTVFFIKKTGSCSQIYY